MAKIKSLVILLMILATGIPIYYLNKYLQRVFRPRKSLAGLFLYFLIMCTIIFLFTFAIVFAIRRLFLPA